MKWRVFAAIRVVMAFLSVTWYVPDETWQSVEVAHGLVFQGQGHQTWEWRPDVAIRSYLHPLIFVPAFYLLKWSGCDTPYMVEVCPRLLQGALSAVADVFAVKFFRKAFSEAAVNCFIFLYASNWNLLYSGSRTLVNQLELVLTCVALYFYTPTRPGSAANMVYVALISLSFVIRPTTAILWLPLVVNHLLQIVRRIPTTHGMAKTMFQLILVSLSVLATCSCIDSALYGTFAFVPWNFVKFNVLHDVSSQYGTHPWHWYFSDALPALLLGPLGIIPLLGGVWRNLRRNVYAVALLSYLAVYSIIRHKEHRFLLPVMPLCVALAADFLHRLAAASFSRRTSAKKVYVCAVLLCHLGLTVYLSCVHQSGTTSVIRHLSGGTHDPVRAVSFLMPCHSTPFHSHLHRANVSLHFLQCPPRLPSSLEGLDPDESALFQKDPVAFVSERRAQWVDSVSHIVCFDDVSAKLHHILTQFRLCADFFHSHFPNYRRVHLYCRLNHRSE